MKFDVPIAQPYPASYEAERWTIWNLEPGTWGFIYGFTGKFSCCFVSSALCFHF